MKHLRAAVMAASLGLAGQAATGATIVYEGGFPTGSWGGSCSPCGTFTDRTFDLVDLGSAGLNLTRIDVAVNDTTAEEGATASGVIEAIEIAIYDAAETLLKAAIFTAADWSVIDVIDDDNYTLAITLPDWLISEQFVWISPFGRNGSTLGLFYEGTPQDGIASQTEGPIEGFSELRNVKGDLALRVWAGDPLPDTPAPIPLPGGLPLAAGALALLALLGRRRAA